MHTIFPAKSLFAAATGMLPFVWFAEMAQLDSAVVKLEVKDFGMSRNFVS